MVSGVPAKPIAKVTVPLTLTTSYKDFKKGLKPILSRRTASNVAFGGAQKGKTPDGGK
jgi:hypothetical protein